MKERSETIYVKADRNSVCHDRRIKLGDVMSVSCINPAVVVDVKKLTLYVFEKKENVKGRRVEVFSILNVIEKIQEAFPTLEVVSYGEPDFVVEYVPFFKESKLLERFKTVLLSVLIFFGSAFTIMTFNNDVSINGVFEKFYGQFMGVKKPPVTELEIFYCIGLAIGILVFFNHVGKKKITIDPTPIQVEMRKYEKDVDTTLIDNAGRKGHAHDVD